jgi:hypothetical protein
VDEDDDLRITDDADPLVSPSTEKHKQETGKSDYFKVEQKLREERIAKKLIPTSKDAEEDNHTIRTQLRRDRQNPKCKFKKRQLRLLPESPILSAYDYRKTNFNQISSTGLHRRNVNLALSFPMQILRPLKKPKEIQVA